MMYDWIYRTFNDRFSQFFGVVRCDEWCKVQSGGQTMFFPNYRFPICIRIGIGIILFTRTRNGTFHDFDDVFETDVPSLATVISMIPSLVKSSGRCYDEFT